MPTFGDRWTVGSGKPANARAPRGIDLVLMCTDFNRLQSLNFLFLVDNHRLFYNTRDWARLFPAHVLAAMEQCARSIDDDTMPGGFGYTSEEVCAAAAPLGDLDQHLRLLPKGKDLPIIVGTRASMAFPGLFTPLPLWLLCWISKPELPDERRPIL